jgi:hypothetical protein
MKPSLDIPCSTPFWSSKQKSPQLHTDELVTKELRCAATPFNLA